MSLIAVSGKINSGKDLTGKIIQILTCQFTALDNIDNITEDIINKKIWDKPRFTIEKFANALKNMVCILLGCTRKQLENRDFKEKELGEEWWHWYGYNYKLTTNLHDGRVTALFSTEEELIELEKLHKIGFTRKQVKLTPRKLLQLIGTECGRDIIHPNIWVNALFSKYNSRFYAMDIMNTEVMNVKRIYQQNESNWIITDMRFPNELKAVKDRSGISIRVNREVQLVKGETYTIDSRYSDDEVENNIKVTADYDLRGYDDLVFVDFKGLVYRQADYKIKTTNQHESETALDNSQFDYVINNNGSINDLVLKVKEIIIKASLL